MSPKLVKKLVDKKHRNETGLFIVEGDKNIRELLLSDFDIVEIFGTSHFLNAIHDMVLSYEAKHQSRSLPLTHTRGEELVRMGSFVSNDFGIAVVRQKKHKKLNALLPYAKSNFVLVLDDVRDPGNLGTIIRIADWYGVNHIVASLSTTDVYNPKTISSTMGSFTRVSVYYGDHVALLKEANDLKMPVIAADMHGKSTHEGNLPKNGFVVMGSESHGVSDASLTYTSHRVTIPRFGNAESLNVSVATGILFDSLRRK